MLRLRRGSLAVVAGDGRPLDPHWGALTTVHTGAAFAAYDVLQELGFDFWHPLQPLAPASLRMVRRTLNEAPHAPLSFLFFPWTWHN